MAFKEASTFLKKGELSYRWHTLKYAKLGEVVMTEDLHKKTEKL